MTTITIEVSDDLTAKLNLVREQLPSLLDEVMNSRSGQSAVQTLASTTSHQAYEEMIGFPRLRSFPGPNNPAQSF